jgi:Mlc titration factor MtfA (ptsG expression regulator)
MDTLLIILPVFAFLMLATVFFLIKKKLQRVQPLPETNEAEFFAVATEYLFERPDLLQTKHPGLCNVLSIIVRQKPESI